MGIDTLAKVEVTADQLDLVRRTIATGATSDELHLYLYDCQRQGVHPLDKLLHFTKRGGKYTPITSIDLMRIRAAETGECLGISDPQFTGDPRTPAFAARVTVYRLVQGKTAEFSATARWSEYCPPAGQDHMWQKMPHTMLGKCAEALALRKGFPKQLAGLYAREEMDQVEPPNAPPALAPDTHQPLPLGAVYIERTTTTDTKNANVKRTSVVFSDGVEASLFDAKRVAEIQALSEEGVPVTYVTEQKGRFVNLVSVTRAPMPANDDTVPGELRADEIIF